MMLLLIKQYWKYIAIVLALVVAYLAVYNQGYSKAYARATEQYNQQLLERNRLLIEKLDSIEALAIKEEAKNNQQQTKLAKDLNQINLAIKNKTLTTEKNGECIPSQDFLDSYNSIILRGNQK